MRSQSYKDLMVWQKSIELCVLVYKACEAFPKSELYCLSDQMRRAAVSIASNIAEGQGRQHKKEFLHFLSVANGSLAELDTQRIIAEQLSFLSSENSNQLNGKITEVSKMLYSLANAIREQLKTEN